MSREEKTMRESGEEAHEKEPDPSMKIGQSTRNLYRDLQLLHKIHWLLLLVENVEERATLHVFK